MTGSETGELLPCPFCGGKAAYYLGTEGAFRATWEVHLVHCTACQARVQTTAKENTIRAWNTRAQPQADGEAGDWKLVPVVPTLEMQQAGYEALKLFFPDEKGPIGHYRIYEAMLAVSPESEIDGVGQNAARALILENAKLRERRPTPSETACDQTRAALIRAKCTSPDGTYLHASMKDVLRALASGEKSEK